MTAGLRGRKRQHYLSGIDWFVRALDGRTRYTTGVGNQSQIVLVLRGELDPAALRRKLTVFVQNNPVLSGRCRRNGFNLAPYWSATRAAHSRELRFDIVHPPDALDAQDIIDRLGETVSQPLAGPLSVGFRVAFHCSRTYVVMQFNHQILDAVGAERLLAHFSESDFPTHSLPLGDHPAHLNRWGDKFRSGQIFNREMSALRKGVGPSAVPLPACPQGRPRPSRFAFRTYSETETERIHKRAEHVTGYLLLLPYLVGVSVHALHVVCRRMSVAQGDYIIPVSVRYPPGGSDSIFFNNISFNFYRFGIAAAASRTALCNQAVQQMYVQVQKRLAYHVANAAMLMRILPAAWLARLMVLPLGGSMGSMSFAFIGQTGYTSSQFMRLPVENVYHMPRVPTPPGIGVVFSQYHNRLTLALSYLDGMLDKSAVSMFMEDIDAALTGDD